MSSRREDVTGTPDARVRYTRRRRTPYRITPATAMINQAATTIVGHGRQIAGDTLSRATEAGMYVSLAGARSTTGAVVTRSAVVAGITCGAATVADTGAADGRFVTSL